MIHNSHYICTTKKNVVCVHFGLYLTTFFYIGEKKRKGLLKNTFLSFLHLLIWSMSILFQSHNINKFVTNLQYSTAGYTCQGVYAANLNPAKEGKRLFIVYFCMEHEIKLAFPSQAMTVQLYWIK